MILELIQNYISQKADLVNANYSTNIQLKQIQTELELSKIGMSESFIHYQLFISELESIPNENSKYDNVRVRLDFVIQVANKNYTIYKKVFDRYLFAFRRVLKKARTPKMVHSNEEISAGLRLIDIHEVNIINADNFEEGYYKPSITFTLKVSDSGTLETQILKSETV